jgi:hypothetical protein
MAAAVGVMVCYFTFSSLNLYLRLPTALLSVATRALRSHFSNILLVLFGAISLQVTWLFATVAAVNSTLADNQPQYLIALIIFASFWVSHTLKCVVQAVVGGTVAFWWFQPQRAYPVSTSFNKMVTLSFGSLVIAGLFSMLQIFETLFDGLSCAFSSFSALCCNSPYNPPTSLRDSPYGAIFQPFISVYIAGEYYLYYYCGIGVRYISITT